jgi:DNA-binding Lrp family transcriptional regulator
MGNEYDQRRRNVIKVIRDKFGGSKARFADRMGQTPSYISRVTTDKKSKGARNISESKAREWEAKCGIPDGWLDKPHDEYRAYVMIMAKHQETEDVMEYLKSIPQIKEATAVSGGYDILTKIVADDRGHLDKIVANEIRNEFIINTKTYHPMSVDWGYWKREKD